MAKILIIDDDPAILIMLKKMLEKAGHTVEVTDNGLEGLEKIESWVPDLLVTDIIMPEKEGLELIISLRQKRPALKIIAISGGGRFNYEGYLTSAKYFGAERTFQKPLNHKEFIQSVSEVLNSPPENINH